MDTSKLCMNCFQEKDGAEPCPHCGYVLGGASKEHYYLPEGSMLQNRYIVGTVLGHGGFGITYIGYDTKLEKRVAVKEYLPTDISTRVPGQSTVTTFSGEKYDQFAYGLERFIGEAKTLARYGDNPGIVSISDYFNENNTAYIVMEYLDGITLSEYLKRSGGTVSYEETASIIRPVMDALREVHGAGMIHRDVSPDNIFITTNNQVKLLDFGAARHAMGEKSKSLSVVLKPGYAPPEQYYARGKQGPWTDVYALGATIYRMLTGENPPEAIERMTDDTLRDIGELDLSVSRDFAGALMRALAVTAKERYQTIAAFEDALFGEGGAPVAEASADYINNSAPTPAPAPEPSEAKAPPQAKKPEAQADKPAKDEKKKILIGGIAAAAVVALIVIISMIGNQQSSNTSLSSPAATLSSVLQDSSMSINTSPSASASQAAEATQTTEVDDASEIYQKAVDYYDNGELYEAYALLKTISDYDKALSMIDEIKADVFSYAEGLIAEIEVPKTDDLTEYKDMLRELDTLKEYVTQFYYYGSDLTTCDNIRKDIGNIYDAVLDEYTIRFFNQLSAEKYLYKNYVSYSFMVNSAEDEDIYEAYYEGSTIDVYTEESEITYGLCFTDPLQAGTYLNFTRYWYSFNRNSYAFERASSIVNKQISAEYWTWCWWGPFGNVVRSSLNGVYCIEVYIEDDNTLIARQPFLINISS